MDKCPACGAPWKKRERCHRCKADLSTLIRVEEKSGDCLKRAVTAFQNKEYEAALLLADRSRALKFTQKADHLRQYAARLAGAGRSKKDYSENIVSGVSRRWVTLLSD